jgi:hypothetical protein
MGDYGNENGTLVAKNEHFSPQNGDENKPRRQN